MAAAKFDYHAPSSVEEALNLLSGNDDAKILAGGHSLIPMMKTGLAAPGTLIDLGKVGGLSYINESNGGLAIGAMTTYQELATSDAVASNAAVLGEAAASVADPQVRNMGTIGGSLAHADPAGDLPAVAIALNAEIVATSSGGERIISADDFFIDLFTTALQPDEIVTEIRIPSLGSNTGAAYAKMANKASHYAIVGVAAVVSVNDDGNCTSARIGVTGAGASASRAEESESRLVGSSLDDAAIFSAAGHATDGIELNEDIHASAEYREHLTKVFALRAIRSAVERATG
ncbi:MAG: xanthine dehydrogenase family protein subunit M [Dehalococcoidia bacterium]|nr:xanthine dehydrogenase family protein subunit M [Dehalococcoidia bacterium]